MRILVGNEPRSYCEVIIVAPEDLDGAVVPRGPRPQLVPCSRLTEVVETRGIAWVLLYPHGEAHVVISSAGRRQTAPDLELDGLLCRIAQTELLAREDA